MVTEKTIAVVEIIDWWLRMTIAVVKNKNDWRNWEHDRYHRKSETQRIVLSLMYNTRSISLTPTHSPSHRRINQQSAQPPSPTQEYKLLPPIGNCQKKWAVRGIFFYFFSNVPGRETRMRDNWNEHVCNTGQGSTKIFHSGFQTVNILVLVHQEIFVVETETNYVCTLYVCWKIITDSNHFSKLTDHLPH